MYLALFCFSNRAIALFTFGGTQLDPGRDSFFLAVKPFRPDSAR